MLTYAERAAKLQAADGAKDLCWRTDVGRGAAGSVATGNAIGLRPHTLVAEGLMH